MKTYDELQAENAAIKAQVEMLREVANDAIYFATKRKDKVCADPMFVMQQLQGRIDATPVQCLREIRAEEVEEAIDATYDEIRNRIGKDYSNIVESIILEYAAKVRQGGEI